MPRHASALTVLLAAVLVACSAGPAGTGAAAGGSTGPALTHASTGAIGSGRPAPPLPDASLSDPVEIAAAIADPGRADVGIASAVAVLGIGVYGADGKAIRKGRETTANDLWLTADELLGLIAMDRQDLAAIAAKDPAAPTLGDLLAAIAGVAPGSTADGILTAFETAYASRPGVVGAVADGLSWSASTPATRATLWLLFVDAYVLPKTSAGRSAPLAAAGHPAVELPPAAAAGLPPIPGQAGLQAVQFALLAAHAMLLGFTIPLTVDPVTASVHEGHGAVGTPQQFVARQGPAVPPASPFGGPTFLPKGSLQGAELDWAVSGPMDDHGTFSLDRTLPARTDATGAVGIAYTPRQEAANGQGDLESAPALLMAHATVRSLVTSQFIVPPEALPFLFGDRYSGPANVILEWHEDTSPKPGAWHVTLTGSRAGAGDYRGEATVYCTSTPRDGGGTLWTVTAVPSSGGIVQLLMQMNPDGFFTVSASPAGFGELGPWLAQSNAPGSTAQIVPTINGDDVQIAGQGTFRDNEGKTFSIDILVHCSSVNGGGGGTD